MRILLSMDKKIIKFVTGNVKKLEEIKGILECSSNSFIVTGVNGDLVEYQGEINEICRKKCADAVKLFGSPIFVDDTSLCFDAFGGLPGPYVKWFLQTLKPSGLFNMLSGTSNKSASAICTICYAETPDNLLIFTGETRGTIVEPRGPDTFGWDSCFQPLGYNETYAEMSKEEKNFISHRYKALLKLKEYLEKQ